MLEQVAPTLARGGVSLYSGTEEAGAVARPPCAGWCSSTAGSHPAHAELLRRDPPALLLATRERGERAHRRGRPGCWGPCCAARSLVPQAAVRWPGSGCARLVDMQHAADAAALVVQEAGGSRVAASLAADVLHELAVNAMLDAPVDAQGAAQVRPPAHGGAARWIRRTPASWRSRWMENASTWRRWTGLAGSPPGPFARALDSYGGKVQVNSSGGGAGLGLRRMIEHSDAIAVRVIRGRESRVLCAVDLGDSAPPRRAAQVAAVLYGMRVGPVENQGSNAIISRSRVGNITHVRISGVIDETFPLTSASPDLNGIVILDLGCVDRISSFGVRKWIEFVSKLPSGAIGMYMVYAPPVVVDQLNMVEGFAGVSRVLSVLAPYTCKYVQRGPAALRQPGGRGADRSPRAGRPSTPARCAAARWSSRICRASSSTTPAGSTWAPWIRW